MRDEGLMAVCHDKLLSLAEVETQKNNPMGYLLVLVVPASITIFKFLPCNARG